MIITMHAVKTTAGTVLFKEQGRVDGKDRNLYLPKPDYTALGNPSTIKVEVTAG